MKIGLVLSGGGARGIGHLGVIQVLQELNIPLHCIAGTSAGALVGAFIASNYKPYEILNITQKIKLFDWNTLSIGTLGLLKMNSIEKVLHEYLPEKFELLSIPLHVCATDIINNTAVFFNQGDLIPALLASSSIPVLYEPVYFNNTYFIDGGVLNNLPVESIRKECDKIIAINVNHLSNEKKQLGFKDIIEKSFHLSINQSVYAKQSIIDVFIDPPDMSRFSMFDVKNAQNIFNYTYEYASTMKDKISSILNSEKY